MGSFGPSPDSWSIASVEATHFTTAVADGAIDIENLGSYPTPSVVVSQINIASDENLAWDISIWRSITGQPDSSPLDDLTIAFRVSFASSVGFQYGGSGPFFYSLASQAIRIPNSTGKGCFVGISPRGAGKSADPAGNVRVELIGPVL